MAAPASGEGTPAVPSAFGSGSTLPPAPRPQPLESAVQSLAASGGGLRERFGRIFGGGPPKNQIARCFECSAEHEVSGAAHSTICRDCGAYIDLQDYKITGSFSRNIATRGHVHVARSGVLSSSKIICSEAVIYGKLRGNLVCSGKVQMRTRGRLPGSLEAITLQVDKGSDVEFGLPVKVTNLEIAGRMAAQIISNGHVNVHKHGFLCGQVRAKGFTVEQGGCFDGELTIGPGETFSATSDTESGVGEKAGLPVKETVQQSWSDAPTLLPPDPLAS